MQFDNDLFSADGAASQPGVDIRVARPRNTHIFPADPLGHYVEPPECSVRLFETESFGAPGATVLDPCAGWCRIPQAAAAAGYRAVASDVVDRRADLPGLEHIRWLGTCDFLKGTLVKRPWAVVTNPPFHLLEEIAVRALAVATAKVALFVKLSRLPAAHWLEQLPLESVYLCTPRPSVPPGSYLAAGKRAGGGSPEFCWLVFNNFATVIAPRLRWLHRDGAITPKGKAT